MKKTSFLLLAGLSGLTLMNCKNNQVPAVTVVPEIKEIKDSINLTMPDLLKQGKKIFLSDIASSIRYIPLETTNKFLIGDKNVHVKPCGEYIFVSEHGKPIGAFDRSGKFIRTIGKIGEGPGEYNFDFIFWPDSTSRNIYVWNAIYSTIMTYSFEGKHLGDIKPETRFGAFVPLGNGKFITWTHIQQEREGRFFRLFFHDSTGKTTSYVFEPKSEIKFNGTIMLPLFTPVSGGYLYNTWEEEVIYKIRPDGSFKPALTWVLGNLKLPFDYTSDYHRFKREKANYIIDVNACESPSLWLIKFYHKNQLQMAIYDKATELGYLVSNQDTAQQGIFNDIDGGPSFWPFWDNEGGKTFVRLVNALDMIDYQKTAIRKKVPVKSLEQAARLKYLVSELNENSNPVLMLVDLK